ncbi:efflux RND transporter periplasmic adaptor subunit [Rhizobium grahamii]|uniref:Efflux transporter periplasmic adaptor subunit n=1 Tax=Rhizobium grahamii TaxID=1120045 RepID=A0A370KFQ5_9HYPH|nr:efflux RND transporter periplasmic adaptor subunit [Rhizobium grahamii]RDJ02972.1 efflux transporter periplasmic adaptor subunit [Rhizobium grahamii]
MTRNRLYATLPVLLSISLLAGCDEGTVAEEQANPRPVKTVTATTEPEKIGSLPGIVQARIETDMAFRTLGRIVSRRVEVGDLVSKGKVVAEIDPLSLQLAVRSAEADVRDAQAHLDNAAVTERRKRTLTYSNAASMADYDLAEQQLKSAEADVAKTTASLAKAREQLGYSELRAEFDGVITATFAEMGQTVAAGQTVLRLARPELRDVVVDVPEALLSSGRVGDNFSVALQLDSRQVTLGKVREIAPQADPTTRTYRLKLAIDQAPEIFRLGAVVTVHAMGEGTKGSIPLPISAISNKEGVDHVWVVDGLTGTVKLRMVELETRAAGASFVRVFSGLREGDEVVVAGVNELTDGQKVKREQEPRS